MRGGLGGARAGGLLLVVIAACISIPVYAPLLSTVPGDWWHLYPMAVPSASSSGDRAGSCLHDARQVSVPGTAQLTHPPHLHSVPAAWVPRVFH